MVSSARYQPIDALRGIIMMLMAIDHAVAFIARQHSMEFWAGAMSAYSSAIPFLTRLVTHLCAPGFFFLMGAGVYWSGGVRRTLRRGLLILLAGQALETPIIFLESHLKPATVSLSWVTAPPPMDGSTLYWGVIVLSELGLVMTICALLLRLPPWTWLTVSALCLMTTNSLLPASGTPESWWMAVLLAPGLAQHIIAVYPVIPWLAGAAAGMYFARWWRNNPELAGRRVLMLGVALLAVGLALRAAGGWGNIRLPRDSSWIEFLNNVKYPPSAVYWALALGADLLMLGALVRLPDVFKSARSPLLVFGQTPLFFYIVHFYLLFLCALVFFRDAASLATAYTVWAGALVVLYPLCARYRAFKQSRAPNSLWRMF